MASAILSTGAVGAARSRAAAARFTASPATTRSRSYEMTRRSIPTPILSAS
jgi:hypothetical protein